MPLNRTICHLPNCNQLRSKLKKQDQDHKKHISKLIEQHAKSENNLNDVINKLLKELKNITEQSTPKVAAPVLHNTPSNNNNKSPL